MFLRKAVQLRRRPEFRTGSKPLQVSYFRNPLNSKSVVIWIFRAASEFVIQTMAGRFERTHGLLVGISNASRRVESILYRVYSTIIVSSSRRSEIECPEGCGRSVLRVEISFEQSQTEMRYPHLQANSFLHGAVGESSRHNFVTGV